MPNTDKSPKKIDKIIASQPKGADQAAEFFRDILENSRDGLYCYNFNTQSYEYINNTFESLSGYTPQEFMDSGIDFFLNSLHPDDKESFMDLYESLINNTFKNSEFDAEYRAHHKNGQYRWRSDHFKVVRDEEGNIHRVLGCVRDIHDQKEQTQKLIESQQSFKRLAEASFEAIMIHENGKVIDVNQRFIDMHGYTLNELQTIDVLELIAPKHHEVVLKNLSSGFEDPFEVVGLRKDGSSFPLEIRAKSAIINNRGVRITTSRDLTDHKQRSRQLKASQERYKRLAEASFEGITIHENGTILDVNQQFCSMFGYTQDEVMGMSIYKLTLPEFYDQIRSKIVSKDEKTYQVMGLRKDGSTFPGQIRIREVTLEDKPVRIAVIQDLSEISSLQNDLTKTETRYRELYEDAHAALFRTALDGTLLDCNKACVRFFGYSEDQDEASYLNKIRVTDYYADLNQRKDFLEALRKNKRVKGFEVELKRDGGETFFAAISAELFPERGYIEGSMYDITAKKILTRAEKKVLSLLLEGKSNKQIARELGRSVRTIEDHRSHVMRKFEVDNAFELTQKAREMGFVKVKK